MSRASRFAGAAIGIAALIAVVAFFVMQEPVPVQVHNAFTQGHESALIPPGTQDPFSDQFVRELRRYYGKTISGKATQASLYDLRNSIMGSRPDKGRELFYGILKRAFPEHADVIMATLDKIDQYKRWIEDNKAALSRMSETERLAALQKKRVELFGEDAQQIWTGEELATEARRAKMQDTLAVLNESDDTTMDEKIEVYQDSLRETYQGTPEGFILDQGPLLSKVFFSIDSVQDELKQMTPRDRQEEINRIRQKMGFTQEQVESMARRDADNELRWEAGLQYMQDREAAVQQYEGARLEERLSELREQYFDDEADTIAREEKDGFYRFKRPHIYGRN
jgi:hypothetical protein